jgi:ABC-type sulfate transport system permease component
LFHAAEIKSVKSFACEKISFAAVGKTPLQLKKFMFEQPTQSTPGGFLLVFFGVLSWIVSGLAGYASWLIYQKRYIEHVKTEYSLTSVLVTSIVAFIIGIVLIVIGLRMAWSVGPYDTHDPKEPWLKF